MRWLVRLVVEWADLRLRDQLAATSRQALPGRGDAALRSLGSRAHARGALRCRMPHASAESPLVEPVGRPPPARTQRRNGRRETTPLRPQHAQGNLRQRRYLRASTSKQPRANRMRRSPVAGPGRRLASQFSLPSGRAREGESDGRSVRPGAESSADADRSLMYHPLRGGTR